MTTNQYRQLLENRGAIPLTVSKYHSRKKEVDGFLFDSAAEAKRFQELRALASAKVIRKLELQPKFLLQEGFRDSTGKRHRPITYKADFRYVENGKVIVEDSKGFRTEAYRLKWKWAIKLNPDMEFREVR